MTAYNEQGEEVFMTSFGGLTGPVKIVTRSQYDFARSIPCQEDFAAYVSQLQDAPKTHGKRDEYHDNVDRFCEEHDCGRGWD